MFALLVFPDFFIESLPIRNGFSIKFNPVSTKEEFRPRTFGALFAKISQDFSPDGELRRQLLSKTLSSPTPGLGQGCTNQVARIIFPHKYFQTKMNDTAFSNSPRFINLPKVKPPLSDYKILVATAPPNVKLGRSNDGKKIIVYIVFPNDTEDLPEEYNLKFPEVYFVSKLDVTDVRKDRSEPLFLINNNRTVTGLRSKHVAKFVTFKNQRFNHYSYNLRR